MYYKIYKTDMDTLVTEALQTRHKSKEMCLTRVRMFNKMCSKSVIPHVANKVFSYGEVNDEVGNNGR